MSMFPIRCLVETVGNGDCVRCGDRGGAVVVDSFAIVSGQTTLSQLVETVLAALGLQHLSFGAKGWVQIKNWKPLPFEQITDEQDTEIECLLKDVSNQLTLRILTKQSDTAVVDCLRDMKDRLLRTVLQKVPNLLNDVGAIPQLKEFVTQLVHGDSLPNVDVQQMEQFNTFLDELALTDLRDQIDSDDQHSRMNGNRSDVSSPSNVAKSNVADVGAGFGNHLHHHHHNHCQSSSSNHSSNTTSNNNNNNNNGNTGNTPHNASTRLSQLLEVPKLERWFRENPNPSRQKLQQFMQILNNSNFRKHTNKISYQQICNWFINARATQRRRTAHSLLRSGVGAGVGGAPATAAAAAAAGTGNDPRPNSAGSASNHWVSKVFNNNVRNLSIAFNDFIQSAPNKTTNGGDAGSSQTVSRLSPAAADSSESRSNGSQSPKDLLAIKDELDSEEVTGGDDEDEQQVKGQLDDAGCSSPRASSASLSVALKAFSEGLVSMAGVGGRSGAGSASGGNFSASSANRTRLMFDPLTELPMLEKWFEENPHPTWVQVDQYTDALNSLPYRRTYPPVSSHNVKIWFKNRRAKSKRQMGGSVGDASILV